MFVSKDALVSVLSQFNPWWRGEAIPDLPAWRRTAFRDLRHWMATPSAPRAILLSGAREIGKTTLLLQSADVLRRAGVPAGNILYANFDHPLLNLAGLYAVLDAWRAREPKVAGPEYVFMDEVGQLEGWAPWVGQQLETVKGRRLALAASTMTLAEAVGGSATPAIHTVRLTPLSFPEYLGIRKVALPELPKLTFLRDLFEWPAADFATVAETAAPYPGHFHEYLVRGGFPRAALADSFAQAQRLVREDIVDRILRRDPPARFGVRRIQDLERAFLYLCMQDNPLLDMLDLCANLDVKRPTAQNFIEILQATHLIHRLPPFGYGKAVQRGRFRIHLADPSIAPALLLTGKAVLDDAGVLAKAADDAVFSHLFARYHADDVRFSHWKANRQTDPDLVAEVDSKVIPLALRYRAPPLDTDNLRGLIDLCRQTPVARGYVVTKSIDAFGPLEDAAVTAGTDTRHMRVPAALLCCWLGIAEGNRLDRQEP